MEKYQVIHELERALEKIKTFNHEDEWDRNEVTFRTNVNYSFDDNGKVSIRFFIHEED